MSFKNFSIGYWVITIVFFVVVFIQGGTAKNEALLWLAIAFFVYVIAVIGYIVSMSNRER